SSEGNQTIAIACPRGMFVHLAEPSVRSAMHEVKSKLTRQGAIVRDVDLPSGFAEILPRHRTVMAVEGAQFHESRLRHHPEDYQPRIRELLEEGLRCPAPEYARCKEHQRELFMVMHNFLDNCDEGI